MNMKQTMNMKQSVCGMIAGIACLFSGFAQAKTDAVFRNIKYSQSGDIVLGEWTCQFAKALAYSEANDIPIVVFWGNSNCPHCEKTEASIASNEFVNWQKSRGLVMSFTVGGVTPSDEGSAAYSFCRNNSLSIPRMAVYWKGHKLADGTLEKAKLNMPDKTASQLIDTIEKYLANYDPNVNSDFGFEESVCNRYEAESATTSVTVSLARASGGATLEEQLLVLAPDGKTQKAAYDLAWAVDETNKSVAVAIPANTLKKDGDQLTLQVQDRNGAVKATTHVTYVEKANSAANPAWVGEKLAFGKWTADLDGAKQFAADNDGYTLVCVQGSMWCPDCANTERNFLDLEEGGVNRFEAWAEEKNVMLVSMDVPNYKGTNVADHATPTLFTTEAYATKLARNTAKENPAISGADPVLTNEIVRSGRGYQSRKGISAEAAYQKLCEFHDLSYKFVADGGFRRPEDPDNLGRTYDPGIPSFILLRRDGTVAARFTRFNNVSPMLADRANWQGYVNRLEEMISIAGTEGEWADASETENNWPCVEDALTMAANGGSLTSTLCNADFQDAVKLTGLTGGATQKISITGDSDAGVTVQLYRLAADGMLTTVGATHVCAKLSDGMSFTQDMSGSGTYFALVKGRDITSEAFAAESAKANHFITYELSGVTVYIPADGQANGVAGSGGTAEVRLVRDELYCFKGLNASACSDALEAIDETVPHEYFRALVSGDVGLAVSGGAGTPFAYQLWHPGTVGFKELGMTVKESVNDLNNDWLDIVLKRTDGASGAVKVRVSVDVEATTLVNYAGVPRYALLDAKEGNSYADYVWDDGVGTNLACRVRVLDEVGYDGDGDLVLKVEVLASTAGGVTVTEGKDVYTLTVTEDDKAAPGRAMVTRVDPFWAKKQTVYARESEGAKIWAARIEASDGLVGVEVKSSLSGVAFATENPRDLGIVYDEKTRKLQTVLWWANRETAEKYLWVTNVPAGKSAKITLNNHDSFKVVSASNAVTVVSVADDAPAFADDTAFKTLYRYVAFSNAYKVTSWQGGKLTFTKLSGTLPTGLKVAFDAETGAMAVSGVPTASDTKTGVKRFESCYQVTEERVVAGRKTKVAGLPICLVYDVVDPTLTGGEGGAPLNAYFKKGCTYTDIPVVDTEYGFLAGTLQVTIPATGKASAKLLSSAGTLAFSCKQFQDVLTAATADFAFGAFVLEMDCTTKNFEVAHLRLGAGADGTLVYMLTVPGLAVDGSAPPPKWSKNDSASAYQGSYVLAMPTNAITESVEGLAPSGSPYLTLKMTTASQWNAGKMTWAGVLANGTTVSGTAVLTEEQLLGGKVAYLPIVKQSKTDFFSAWLQIGQDKTVAIPTAGTVEEPVAIIPTWDHIETAKALSNVIWSVRYDLYGGVYVAPEDGTYELLIDTALTSEEYGEFGPVESPKLVISNGKAKLSGDNPDKVSLSLSTAGIVSGTFKLPYVDGLREKTLSATYKGVVVRGFEGRPMLNGAWTFTDKYQKTNIKRGSVVTAR